MMKKKLLAALMLMGILASVGMFLPVAFNAGAQDKTKRETIQATAMGQQRALPMLLASAAFPQDTSTSDDRELNLRAYTELLRADVKAKRVAIITEIMQFSDADAATFWPLFRDYDYELSKLGDTRVQLISDYIKNYDAITNERADELANAAFSLEAQRAELKKKHFDIMKKALSARTAARFFQVENQMQQIVDLQISSNLPALQ